MKLIQVRHVPEEVHRSLKSRAALRGVSLSDYVLAELERVVRLPAPEELERRIRERGPAGVTTQQILRAREEGRRA